MASGVARAAARADAFIAVRAVAHADLENYDGGARAAARADLDALNELAANVNGDVLLWKVLLVVISMLLLLLMLLVL